VKLGPTRSFGRHALRRVLAPASNQDAFDRMTAIVALLTEMLSVEM